MYTYTEANKAVCIAAEVGDTPAADGIDKLRSVTAHDRKRAAEIVRFDPVDETGVLPEKAVSARRCPTHKDTDASSANCFEHSVDAPAARWEASCISCQR